MQEFETSPIFFNTFINPLKDITKLIEKKDYFNALMTANTLLENLTYPNWVPFPDYPEILNKLDIQNILNKLRNNLFNSYTEKVSHPDLSNNLKKLMVTAHMLNFLDRLSNKKTEFKKAIGIYSKHFRGYDITRTRKLTSACRNQSIWVKPMPDHQNFEYREIIGLINCFNQNNGVQALSEYLFSDMDKKSDENIYNGLDLRKHNIFDKKYAILKSGIESGNAYKNDYNSLVEKIAAQNDESEEQSIAPGL
jgi:hypothetical protein